MSGYPVVPPSEQDASAVAVDIANLTTTRQKISYPSGAKWVTLRYRQLMGGTQTTGQYCKIVVNAASDADADGKLATSGGYISLVQGDDLTLSSSDHSITRIDVISAVAFGSETSLLSIMAGV